MNKPFAAYNGTEPYTFVCYAHKDADNVYSDLIALNNEGVLIWYDEGIPAGTSWRAEIASSIKSATKFIFFISEASLGSTHCLREIDYALNNDIEIIPVYLDDSILPGELDLALSRVQALFRKSDSMYMEHLVSALRGNAGFVSIRGPSKKRYLNIGVPILLLGFILLAGYIVTQRESPKDRSVVSTGAVAQPSAFNSYLEGLKLMERWDKGDNLDNAISLFREASSLDPTFALAFARLSEALRIRYVLTREETWLDEAAENADEAVRLNADLAPVQVALGRIHAARGNVDLAFAAIERALALDPNDAIANQAIANNYERQGRLEDAEAAYLKALALEPENLFILNGYANFLFAQSRFKEAADIWQVLIRLAPDHYVALVNMGSALSQSGRIAEAITMYERAIGIHPTYMAYSNLGVANFQAKRYPDSEVALLKALEIDDSDWLAWGNLAYTYSWMNGVDDPQALEAFRHAIQLAEATREQSPRDPFVYSDLALYYAKTGQRVLALQRAGTATTLSPGSGEIQSAAAEAYEILGERDRAIEYVKKSLELGFPQQQLLRNPEFSELLLDPQVQELL